MTDAAMDIWLDSAQYDGENPGNIARKFSAGIQLARKPGRRFNQWQVSQNQTVMHH